MDAMSMSILFMSKKFLFSGVVLVMVLVAPGVSFAAGYFSFSNDIPADTPALIADKCSSHTSSISYGARVVKNQDNSYTCTIGAIYYQYDSSGNQVDEGNATLIGGNVSSKQPPAECAGWSGYLGDLPTCMFRTFVAGAGALFMSISAWILGVSGLLFNWLVDNTIVSFGSVYTSSVSEGVNLAWTAFRDVANILIIGVFVFIAIGIILGLKEYGQKKFIASIIIIAVLINFSLLFTKMIVDFSNFTAGQFYNNIGASTIGTAGGIDAINTTGANPTGGYVNTGIAGKFIQMTGVAGISDAYSSLITIANTNDNVWLALLHGSVASTLFLIAAAILLYGSYIRIVRAVLIIFLLLTSALAFASYIIPNKKIVERGWTLWWDSLIKVAVLAPILMIFLWATSNIADAVSKGSNLGSLGKLTSTAPVDASTIAALFNYLIVVGLLFAAFKVSNSIAGSMGSFNLPAMLATAPLALASRFGVAPLMRQTLGRFALGAEERKGADLKES